MLAQPVDLDDPPADSGELDGLGSLEDRRVADPRQVGVPVPMHPPENRARHRGRHAIRRQRRGRLGGIEITQIQRFRGHDAPDYSGNADSGC